MPKVSVIIPVYNVEKYIEHCVRSLMEQTLEDMEFIFVDDCSPDNSIAILQRTITEYSNRQNQVKILHHEKNSGSAQARVTGIKNATAEYIIYCDSDDWVDTEMYEKMYNKAIEENADIVSTDLCKVYDKNVISYIYSNKWSNNTIDNLKLYISSTWTITVNLLVKIDVYNRMIKDSTEALIRTPNLKLSYCEDFHLTVRLIFYAKKIVRLEESLYYYNQLNTNSIMRNENKKTMYDEQKAYIDIIGFFKEKGIYPSVQKELCWRILKSKQELVLSRSMHKDFLSLHPESHKYILSCPFINFKLKIMMWTLTHHCSFLTNLFISLRNCKEKFFRK